MHDLQKAMRECQRELDALGIPYGNVVGITKNSKARTRWGQCTKKPNGTYSIEISEILLDDTVPIKALKSTIMHELIHTCPRCFDHGTIWKHYANDVNKHYGYDVKRANNANENGIDITNSVIKNAKYVFKCNKCGQIVVRSRASKFTKHPESYRCATCSGKFTQIK